MKKYLALILSCVLIPLAVLELGCRLFLIFAYGSPADTYLARCGHQPDPLQGFELKPNQRDIHSKCHNTVYNTNSKGFRGTEEYSSQKEANEFRVALIGESSVFGNTASSDAKTISALLQSKLQTAAFGKKIMVMNAGNPGHISPQVFERLAYKVLPYQPDLVVIYTGWNDLLVPKFYGIYEEHQILGYEVLFRPSWQHYIWEANKRLGRPLLLRPFALSMFWSKVEILMSRLSHKKEPKNFLQDPAVRENISLRFKQNLEGISALVSHKKIPAIFVTLFSEFDYLSEERQLLNGIVKKLAQDSGQILLDADQSVMDLHLREITNQQDKYHLTDKGNEFLAEQLSEKIRPFLR